MSRLAAALLALIASAACASAQQDADSLPTRPLESLDGDFSRTGEDLTGLASPNRPEIPGASGAGQLILKDVRFEGATVFSDEQLRAALSEFIGSAVSIEDLESARLTISQLYFDAGYINSGAIVPRQKVDDGVVLFKIIEGKLVGVHPSGEDIGDDNGFGGQLKADYVKERLRLSSDRPLNVDELREQFGVALEDPMIERLRGTLTPGDAPGEAYLDLDVKIRDPIDFSLSLNNHNPVSNGAEGIAGMLNIRNLTGYGDISRLDAKATEGRLELGGRVEFPLLAGRLIPFAEASYGTSDVVENPFSLLDISNAFVQLGGGLTWKLYTDTVDRVKITASLDHKRSRTTLGGAPFPPPGVDDDTVNATSLRITPEWVRRRPNEVLALRSTLSFGLPLFSATDGDAKSGDGSYVSVLGQAQYTRRISDNARITARAQGQLAFGPLPSFERVGLGGVSTVRGFRQNIVSRDNAFLSTLEASLTVANAPVPEFTEPGQTAPITASPFIDFGVGWNAGPNPKDRIDMVGVGVGLSWRPKSNVLLNLIYARPLVDTGFDTGDGDLSDEAIYFNVTFFSL